jgi:NhaC family Na+:H+ antiporter
MAATLGVATAAYLPFAFFNLINPALSFIFDATGFQIKQLPDEEMAEQLPAEPEQISQYGVSGYSTRPDFAATEGTSRGQ